MKVPKSAIFEYASDDADTAAFLDVFDEPLGLVMEVGAHDEPVANLLSDLGFNVVGIDLREYHSNEPDKRCPKLNYHYIRHDFCDLSPELTKEFIGKVDCIVSLSAIEHFGYGTYGEGGKESFFYDVIAMRTMWQLLREGGTAYITVPFGKTFTEHFPHWRIYDKVNLIYRLVQDFTPEYVLVFVSADIELNGKKYGRFDPITTDEAASYDGNPPHVSIVMKLRKITTPRLAPDGR